MAETSPGSVTRPGRGRVAAQPQGMYVPQQRPSPTDQGGLVISFHGEDGRTARFDLTDLPCPQLHEALAAAFAARTGPTGARRTQASARSVWGVLKRFLSFLESLPRPPAGIQSLRVRHLDRFRLARLASVNPNSVAGELGEIRMLLAEDVLKDVLHAQLAENVRHDSAPTRPRKEGGVPGYSEREFADLMRAARADVAAIRARLRRAEQLAKMYETRPEDIEPAERDLAAMVSGMLRTGQVPRVYAEDNRRVSMARWKLRGRLAFLTDEDLAPLLVLGVGLSGRNGETLKELAAEHHVVGGKAVAVDLVKRRRGKTSSREGVHWEIGASESRQLHTPGGFYLLLHELTRRGRGFSASQRVWSLWTPQGGGPPEYAARKKAAFGHFDPFELSLSRGLDFDKWVARHGLKADGPDGKALRVTLNRVKTTVEVRTVKELGGHLPSASRTNTMDVSFLHYLRNDPRIREWADEILTSALEDARNNAEAFHLRIVDPEAERSFRERPEQGAAALGASVEQVKDAMEGNLDTLVASCLDIEHSPMNGGGHCDVSFELCLRCPNALIAARHLPMLLGMLDFIQVQLERRPVEDWCARHGVTWLILTRLVLPRFTPAQVQEAAARKPVDFPSGLLEDPWGLM